MSDRGIIHTSVKKIGLPLPYQCQTHNFYQCQTDAPFLSVSDNYFSPVNHTNSIMMSLEIVAAAKLQRRNENRYALGYVA